MSKTKDSQQISSHQVTHRVAAYNKTTKLIIKFQDHIQLAGSQNRESKYE